MARPRKVTQDFDELLELYAKHGTWSGVGRAIGASGEVARRRYRELGGPRMTGPASGEMWTAYVSTAEADGVRALMAAGVASTKASALRMYHYGELFDRVRAVLGASAAKRLERHGLDAGCSICLDAVRGDPAVINPSAEDVATVADGLLSDGE